ncbi:MAG: hypothetical protein AB1633_00085 [Elusimicrobiota bacterium]
MTRNPILKVLFTFKKAGVRCLLIDGQACIIYGAAEFSRDSDFVIVCNSENLRKLKKALRLLKAKNIYVPQLKKDFLDRGHACHFRCYAKAVKNLRIDIMSKLRGCDNFEKLWGRRFTVKLSNNELVNVIGIEDLVQSKKTQRDKDWFMLKRLVENDITLHQKPSSKKIRWWLLECRDGAKLTALVSKNRNLAKGCIKERPLLKAALKKDIERLNKLLTREELEEREKDRRYWQPLIKELEVLRHKARI